MFEPFSILFKKRKLLVFGDSNSSRPNKKACWPALAGKNLRSRFKIINDSIDGRTTMYDDGSRNGFLSLNKKLKSYTPLEYIVIMLGTNDIKIRYGPPNINDIIDNFGQMLNFIYATSKKTKTILVLPPPIGDKASGDFRGAFRRIIQLSAAMSSLAQERGIHAIDVYSILNLNTDMENDLIHLNRLGREKVANSVCQYFLREL